MKTLLSTNKTTILFLMLLSTAYLNLFADQKSNTEKAIIGLWQTTLSENGSDAILIFEFKPTESDSVQCLINFPEFGMNNIPYGKYLIKHDSIHLPNFVAHLNKDEERIRGIFAGPGSSMELEFIKVNCKPVFEFNIQDKEPTWQHKTQSAIWSPPVIHKDYLIFSNDAGEVNMIRLADKSLAWTFKCGDKVRSRAQVEESNVYVASDDGYLYNIDFATGSLKWKVDIGNGVSPRSDPAKEGSSYDYLCSSPVAKNGIIYIGSKDSCLYAIGSDKGEVLWKYRTGDMIRSTPIVEKGIVYFGSWDHYMYAIDAKTSELIWKFDAYWSIQSSPVIYDNILIFGSRGTFVFAVDKKTGKEIWKTPYWSSWVESSPVIYDGFIYIGSSDLRKIYAIDPKNGEVMSSTHVEGWAWPTVAVGEKHIFTGTIGSMHYLEGLRGRFYAIDRKTGIAKWSYKVDDDPDRFVVGFASSPVLWNNQVIVGGLDGILYGFAVD